MAQAMGMAVRDAVPADAPALAAIFLRARVAARRDGAANEEGEPDILFVQDAAPKQTHPKEDTP